MPLVGLALQPLDVGGGTLTHQPGAGLRLGQPVGGALLGPGRLLTGGVDQPVGLLLG